MTYADFIKLVDAVAEAACAADVGSLTGLENAIADKELQVELWHFIGLASQVGPGAPETTVARERLLAAVETAERAYQVRRGRPLFDPEESE